MRIALVNDLPLALESLRRAVGTIPGASVAWIAKDGAEAVAKCAADAPDVILMDMIMPVMDGVEATRRIMRATPCPILVVTATVEGNAGKVFEALGAGALDAVATPGLAADGAVVRAEPLVRKVQAIALLTQSGAPTTLRPSQPAAVGQFGAGPAMVAIGASTGGPQALATALRALPTPSPWPIVIVQHIDSQFAAGLSDWLTKETNHRVEVATTGDAPTPGVVRLACSEDHLILDSTGLLRYVQEPREAVHRPSVDVFFESLATSGARPGVAVLLTGMGRDGAAGLSSLRAAGWLTLAQDKATSVVWGMPGAAVQAGAASAVLPIEEIGGAIAAGMQTRARSAGRNA